MALVPANQASLWRAAMEGGQLISGDFTAKPKPPKPKVLQQQALTFAQAAASKHTGGVDTNALAMEANKRIAAGGNVARPFQCSECQFVFRAVGGAEYKCPGCGALINVPVEEVPQEAREAAENAGKNQLQITQQRLDPLKQWSQRTQAGTEKVIGHPWVTGLRSSPEWCWALPAPGACDEHLVFLMIGGINMVGRAVDCPSVTRKPLAGPAWFCDSMGRMAKGCAEPMHPSDGQGTGIGMGRSVARRFLRNLPRHGIFLCPSACGWGDTTAKAWDREGVLYAIAIARARTCAQAVAGRIAGVFFHGGEMDATNPEDAKAFEARIAQLLSNIRMDLNEPELPIVVGEIGESFLTDKSASPESWKYARDVNAALHRIGHLPYTECALAPATHHYDRLTFDAAGMDEFGCRYAEAWEKMWQQAMTTDVRIGPDGVPRPKDEWILHFGGLVSADRKAVWAAAPSFRGKMPPTDGRDRRRRRRDDGEDGEGRDRRRRRRQEEGDGSSSPPPKPKPVPVNIKEGLLKNVMGALAQASARTAPMEAPGDKEEDEELRKAAGFDDRNTTRCPTASCAGALEPVPQCVVEHDGTETAACDADGCAESLLVIRAAHTGWLCCLRCDRGFCPRCVQKVNGKKDGAGPSFLDSCIMRADSPDPPAEEKDEA